MRTAFATLLVLAVGAGCDKSDGSAAAGSAAPKSSGAPLGPPTPPPEPRKGMVWVSGGALVAGTPPESLPRIADEEMPGEQVILKGFYIDVFPYPNEEGAIPLTNLTREAAAGLCAEQGKRLCTELEWERACKGPDNRTFEYGDRYSADVCGTGAKPSLRPSGIQVGCRSDFGVRDLHGGVWEWTSSPWGRGTERELVSVRGGNAPAGELVGRCANAMGRPPDSESGTLGFRCCAGAKNQAEVVLKVERKKKLSHQEKVDKKLVAQLMEQLPDEAREDLVRPADFSAEHMWLWHPIGNEELVAIGGCAGLGKDPACGVLIARVLLDRPKLLAWVSSGHWTPTLHADQHARDLWMMGGDDLGQFKRRIAYVWGRIGAGEKERRLPKPRRKRRKR